MPERIDILTREDYDRYRELPNTEPLIDPGFNIEINLRKEIQGEYFGNDSANVLARRNFFWWIWERKTHICEESGAFLGSEMQAVFMSHILTRGAHIEMWNDPRNINILTPDNHRKWETGKREKMKIWDKNKDIIAILKSDYSKLKTYHTFPPMEKPRFLGNPLTKTKEEILKIIQSHGCTVDGQGSYVYEQDYETLAEEIYDYFKANCYDYY